MVYLKKNLRKNNNVTATTKKNINEYEERKTHTHI